MDFVTSRLFCATMAAALNPWVTMTNMALLGFGLLIYVGAITSQNPMHTTIEGANIVSNKCLESMPTIKSPKYTVSSKNVHMV